MHRFLETEVIRRDRHAWLPGPGGRGGLYGESAALRGDGWVTIWSAHGDGFRVVSSGLKRSRLGTLKVHDLLCLSYTSAQPLLKTGRWGGRKGGKCSRRRQRPRPRPGGEGERRPGKQGLGVDEEQGVASQWGACSGC